MNFWQTLALNIIVVIPPFIFLWFKLKVEIKISDKYKIELKKREAFKSVLSAHSHLLYRDMKDEWFDEFSDSVINLLLWCSDDVLYEYALYAREREKDSLEIIEREIHFANSIICFRKELKYENKNKRILPEDIINIFRIGFKDHV